MSVVYRAIWNDDRANLLDEALGSFQGWVRGKTNSGLEVPDQGELAGRCSVFSRGRHYEEYDVLVRVEREVDPNATDVDSALRAQFVEIRPDGSRWTTILRSWRSVVPEDAERLDGAQWLWVDVEAVADTDLDAVVVGAPRLVRGLIETGANAHRRCVPMSTTASEYRGAEGAEQLADVLSHADRDLPVVVFFDDGEPGPAPSFWSETVMRTARQTAGIAIVAEVDQEARMMLSTILGDSYGLRGSGLRIYLPGVDPATERDEWRHREIRYDRFNRVSTTAARLVARRLAPRAASRRAPRSYEGARSLLEHGRNRDLTELWDLVSTADQESRQQRDLLAAADDRYIDLLAEYESVLAERALLRDTARASEDAKKRLLAVLERHDLVGEFWRGSSEASAAATEVPSQAANTSEAAALARRFLSDFLDLPAEACRDLDDLDAAVESSAWGQTSWEGFRALHAYAQELAAGTEPGSFWTWCASSGHPLAWRATPKKLAMAESESLKNNTDLWAKRLVPVDEAVDRRRKIHMEAHLKVAEGGGPLAPRIYFLHSSETHKVHVGFFGPHKYMPNSRK